MVYYVISRFVRNELSGHSLLDDERYFEFFVSIESDFRLYTSRFSVDRILQKYPHRRANLRVIKNMSFGVQARSHVVFNGYSELDVAAFLLRNLFRKPRLILVATNNFSKHRVERRRFLLKAFLFFIRPFLHRLVLHTSYEKRLVRYLDRGAADKSFIKKHHLMTPRVIKRQTIDVEPIISYFGPEKHDKPLKPILDLIKADIECRFSYRLYNVDSAVVLSTMPDLLDRSNVEIEEKWQCYEDYLRAVSDSALVFLTHNQASEGKLSGNFCDCIAMQVPFIAHSMEPMTSFEAQFGALGYLANLDDENWPWRFINNYNNSMYEDMCYNLKIVGERYSAGAIDLDLMECFLK